MAPKIAPSFCWVKISKTLRFPTPKDDLLSYTLANQNLVQSDWNLGEFFGITFKILGDRIWRENKNKVTSYRDYPPPSHPKCKDPKLSPKLIYLSQSHSESSFQAAKKTLSESWEVHVSPIQRVWDRNRLPAWNEPTWQLRPGEKVEILEDFESRSAKKHSNNRSTNTKKTQINTCCWPQEFLEILFFCELCWGSEAFNRQPTTPRPLKEDLIWFHPATAPADETSTGTIRPSMSNPRGESVWSLPSVPTLRGFWHSYSKNMDKEKTYIIYHLLIQWIFNPSTIQDSLRWPHQQFGKEVDTQIDHWRVLPKSKEDVARSSGKKINTRMRMWVYTPEK